MEDGQKSRTTYKSVPLSGASFFFRNFSSGQILISEQKNACGNFFSRLKENFSPDPTPSRTGRYREGVVWACEILFFARLGKLKFFAKKTLAAEKAVSATERAT